jgi:hypothetical protein
VSTTAKSSAGSARARAQATSAFQWPSSPLDAGITLKGPNEKILTFYDHLGLSRATTSRLGAMAVDCVQRCETQLIVIDDLHFIDFRHQNGRTVRDHLKGLANEMPVTFVYVGVRLSERLFSDEGLYGQEAIYAQTSRRATHINVAPSSTATGAGAKAWTQLLKALEPHYLLAHAEPGMLTNHASELHRRTQGHIGSLTNLLDRTCYVAIVTGEETINTSVLQKVAMDNAAETNPIPA